MTREDMKRILDQAGPTPEQEAAMLSAVLSGEAGAQKRRGLSRLAAVSLAAALCAALAVTALAVSPTLREALQNALGLFGPYSQEVEGLCAVDQGIEVKVISALSDGNTAKVYYEVRDLSGDRLDGFLYDDLKLMPASYDAPWVSFGGGGDLTIEYDEETKTALRTGSFSADGPSAEKLTLDFDIRKFSPGLHLEEPAIDPAWIARETLKTKTLENGKVVLAPEQNPRSLDSDCLSLSSFGSGEDGVIHFQVKAEGDASQWDREECVIYFGGKSRSDTAPYYPRTNRYLATRETTHMTAEEKERTDPVTWFEQDGAFYWDVRTGITPADLAEGDVEWYKTLCAYCYTCPPIEGEWSLEIATQPVEQIRVDVTGPGLTLNDITIKNMYLSVLGCTIESDPNGGAGTLVFPLTVYLRDGRVMSHILYDSLYHAGGYAVNHWSFPEPVEPGEVTAIALGQWCVPIENGAALPGYWLEEEP